MRFKTKVVFPTPGRAPTGRIEERGFYGKDLRLESLDNDPEFFKRRD